MTAASLQFVNLPTMVLRSKWPATICYVREEILIMHSRTQRQLGSISTSCAMLLNSFARLEF